MNGIRSWYIRNQDKISWFLTGWLSLSFLNSLSRGDYVNAAISGGLLIVNIALSR